MSLSHTASLSLSVSASGASGRALALTPAHYYSGSGASSTKLQECYWQCHSGCQWWPDTHWQAVTGSGTSTSLRLPVSASGTASAVPA